MTSLRNHINLLRSVVLILAVTLLSSCAYIQERRGSYTTRRDKTAKGAGIGAAAGAAAAILKGKREADEILAGAAIGAAVGTSVGAYMDRQEEKLARIPGTTVERLESNLLLVRFDSGVLFATDSWIIESGARSSLNQVGDVLVEFKKTAIVIQGHTDSSGSEEHNQRLSERRATAVKNYLAGQGPDVNRMTAIGYGEGYPVASNASAGGRRQNRRVEMLLKAKVK